MTMNFSHLRIAFIDSDLPSGGSTIFLVHLAGEIVRRGGQAEILSFGTKNPHREDFRRLNVPVFSAEEGSDLIYEDRLSAILKRLAAFQPHVVVANIGSMAFEVLRHAPKGVLRAGMHHSDLPLVYDMVARYTPWIDVIVGVSGLIVEKCKVRPDFSATVRPVYIPCGVEFSDTPREANVREPLRILYLGRLAAECKRVDLFSRIYDQLKAMKVPFRWTIIGGGELFDTLQSTMPSGPDCEVIFTGPLRVGEIPAAVIGNDVFLLTSDVEGLPLSLLEAMGAGVVPVVSDLPSGIRDVVTPDLGILVDPQNIAGYAEGIAHLHHHRAELLEKSIRCREQARQTFSVAAMADRWLGLLPSSDEVACIEKWPARPPLKPQLGFNPLRSLPPALWLRRILKKTRPFAATRED